MKTILLLCLGLCLANSIQAKDKEDSLLRALKVQMKFMDSVEKALKYQTGIITLSDGKVKLNLPAGFKYLDPKQSNFVLTEVWGNPPRFDILGMIFPANGGPYADSSYAFIISFDDMGYVKDEDANQINYDDMLKEIKQSETEINLQRRAQGYDAIHMVGWAQKPFYDKERKVLHWAKELSFEGEEGNTLNYDIRILGRYGILSLNAVAGISELAKVKADIDQVLRIPEFTTGNRYTDFDGSIDKVAAYTVGGLVAGKVLLKVGFFAKFWKIIVIAIGALGGIVVKFFKRKTV